MFSSLKTSPWRVKQKILMGAGMYYYVYILQSVNYPDRYYTGYTTNIKKRILKHNEGSVPYTSKYRPGKMNLAIAFSDKEKVLSFEKYLKSHSGRAFAKKHF